MLILILKIFCKEFINIFVTVVPNFLFLTIRKGNIKIEKGGNTIEKSRNQTQNYLSSFQNKKSDFIFKANM